METTEPTLETKEEKTVTLTVTVAETLALILNIAVLSQMAYQAGLPIIDKVSFMSFIEKLQEGISATGKQDPAGQGGPEAGSDGSISSGESSGPTQMPLPWTS